MAKAGIILGSALFIMLLSNAYAIDRQSRYQAWQPPAGEVIESSQPQDDGRLQQMVDELNQLINDADKARAADRRFIEDLRDVINQYDWPWRKSLLSEDFTDGRLEKKSLWKILSGDFELKRGFGLHSDVSMQKSQASQESQVSNEEAAAMLIGALLNQAMKKDKQSSSADSSTDSMASDARISAKLPISNAFAIDTSIDVRSSQGHMEIGVYQGQPTGGGYRLVFLPGPSASIEVQRISSRGNSIIEVIDNISARGDKVHHLQWTRNKTGNMQITLNDKTLLEFADRSYKDKFSGLLINNRGGEFAIQRLTIQGL